MKQETRVPKTDLSLKRHREIGQEIQKMREKFITLASEIGDAFGHDGHVYKYACGTILDIEELREHLDEELLRQFIELKDSSIYYHKGESKFPLDALDVQKDD